MFLILRPGGGVVNPSRRGNFSQRPLKIRADQGPHRVRVDLTQRPRGGIVVSATAELST